MMLVLGGGGYAYRNYKLNRPHPIWVPLPINPALPLEKRDVHRQIGIERRRDRGENALPV